MPTDDEMRRFEEERRRQAEAMQNLERGFLNSLIAWLTEKARQVISNVVYGFWDWLKGLFNRR